MVELLDYRVSRIVVLCKDCGQDVGLYPARHKCGISISELPPIPQKSSNISNSKISPSSNNNSESYNSYNLWNKFMTSATAITAKYNAGDSDNESEKDDWDGETHISRILREYYEDKGVDLPNWLYDSDSKDPLSNSHELQTERISKRPILTNRNENRNENKNSSSFEVNNDIDRQNRGRQPKPYNDSTKGRQPRPYNDSTKGRQPRPYNDSTKGSAKTGRSRDKSAPPPSSFDRNNNIRNDKNFNSPKSDLRRTTDDINIKNSNYNKSLPSRRPPPPPPFPMTPEEYKARKSVSSKKSYNQLNLREPRYDNTSNKVGNGYNYNNIQKRNIRQGVPISSLSVQNKNRIHDNYF